MRERLLQNMQFVLASPMQMYQMLCNFLSIINILLAINYFEGSCLYLRNCKIDPCKIATKNYKNAIITSEVFDKRTARVPSFNELTFLIFRNNYCQNNPKEVLHQSRKFYIYSLSAKCPISPYSLES